MATMEGGNEAMTFFFSYLLLTSTRRVYTECAGHCQNQEESRGKLGDQRKDLWGAAVFYFLFVLSSLGPS